MDQKAVKNEIKCVKEFRMYVCECVSVGSPLWGVDAAVGWLHSLQIPALREP